MIGILTGVALPFGLSVSILVVGWLLYVDRLPAEYAPRMVIWLVFGVVVTGGMAALFVGYERAHGAIVVHATHVVVNSMSGGAAAGLLIGYYDGQRKRWLEQHRTSEQVVDTIRRVNQRVVEAESRDELFDAICTEFAASDPYVFAWVGTDHGEEIRPVAAAGVSESYLDEIEISLADDDLAQGPTATAVETGEIQVVQYIRTDPEYEPWRKPALEYGFRSSAAIPIHLAATRYGVLNVYSDRPEAFTDREERVLEDLSDAVAHALYRLDVERRQREQYEQLERENERLDRFASIVSHDLRNPLNVAELHTDMLADTCDDDSHLPKIEDAHERMEEIIEDTLTLAREGEAVTETEPIHLASLAERCWATVDTADATLSVTADAVVEADEERLRHVFENLFRNSVEHGGETATVTVGPLEAASRSDGDGTDSTAIDGFYVEDDGPGIPPGEREKVFEPGYSDAEDGTGLGLAIVREIVDAHGWDVTITESGGSEAEQRASSGGAQFEITGVDGRLAT
ncbi:Signal transduction histidine kinase [Halorientalis persicus]|uniref:histidine kinase n=1 Tax=Halorientalis persicus TaxID=1367881 RepID=A0A1H8JMS2_9EURY|nr:GAF domain-containing protein [Halorientalis persicus]SEN81841.1 Signal transduction histidine kinase [Halorientalis persicus]